jgi:hypothetical protein
MVDSTAILAYKLSGKAWNRTAIVPNFISVGPHGVIHQGLPVLMYHSMKKYRDIETKPSLNISLC